MSMPPEQRERKQKPARQPDPERTRKIFHRFLTAIAAVGLFLLISAYLQPHKTGAVLSVGRVSTYTSTTGVGKNRHKHTGVKADVKVQAKDTGERETVYYRVPDPSYLPAVGDEIAFGHSFLVGNTPYPAIWAVRLGWFILGLDGLAAIGYLIVRVRKQTKLKNKT